jgi:hypothetical protein
LIMGAIYGTRNPVRALGIIPYMFFRVCVFRAFLPVTLFQFT